MREEILAYKRERIIEEAVKLFYARGFTGTTLDDIAAELGVTKPFIYTHFRSKMDLLAALCTPTIEMSLAAVENAAKLPGRPTERLHRAIVDFTAGGAVAPGQHRDLLPRGEEPGDPKRWPRSTRCAASSTACCRSCWPRATRQANFDIADVNLAALAIGGMISWAYTWHRPKGRLQLDEMCTRMADLALQMAGVEKTFAVG